ncbi:MAG: helix-turn-helix domain-containing protein [Firmicutes bacterium]|nr:helix-turn-helix domain-containing protein [Bacillota bacterium]
MGYYARVLILLLLSVLIPCTIVFGITNYITLDQFCAFVSAQEVNRLQAVNSINQLIIENMEQTALRFSLEPQVQLLGEHISLDLFPGNTDHMNCLVRVINLLNEYVRTNMLYDSVYFYIKNSDYIVTSRSSVGKLDRFADLGWYDRYLQLQQDRRANRMLPARPIKVGFESSDSGGDWRRCLTYICPITLFTSTFEGALIFNLYEDKLLEMYMERSSRGNISIFDDEGNWLTGVKGIEIDTLNLKLNWEELLNEETPSSGYYLSNQNGGFDQYTYYRSAENRLVLVSVEDIGAVMKRAADYQRLFFAFLILLLPLTALLVVMVSRRLYSPIGKLVRELSISGKLNMTVEKNEWSAIYRAVEELLREDRRLFSAASREKLRNGAFLRVLTEEIPEGDDEVQAIAPYPVNVCLIANIDEVGKACGKGKNDDSFMRLLLRLIEREMTGERMQTAAMRYDCDQIVAIISLPSLPEGLAETVGAKIRSIQKEAKALMDYTVTFAVGSLVDCGSVRLSFEQAKSVLEYRFVQGPGSILFFDEINGSLIHYNADERIKYIQSCLLAGKKEEMIKGVRELFADIKAKQYVSFTYVSQILSQLVVLLTQYAIDHKIKIEELLMDKAFMYKKLWQNHTLDEAGEWFCGLVAEIMAYQQSTNGKYIGEILSYVKNHYSENITIENIADHVGLSYSHLRKVFKDATGRNLAEYINALRLEKAKQLLLETNYTVKQVAALCGFYHEKSFSRAFAQAEGISPGKYKSMAQKAN